MSGLETVGRLAIFGSAAICIPIPYKYIIPLSLAVAAVVGSSGAVNISARDGTSVSVSGDDGGAIISTLRGARALAREFECGSNLGRHIVESSFKSRRADPERTRASINVKE